MSSLAHNIYLFNIFFTQKSRNAIHFGELGLFWWCILDPLCPRLQFVLNIQFFVWSFHTFIFELKWVDSELKRIIFCLKFIGSPHQRGGWEKKDQNDTEEACGHHFFDIKKNHKKAVWKSFYFFFGGFFIGLLFCFVLSLLGPKYIGVAVYIPIYFSISSRTFLFSSKKPFALIVQYGENLVWTATKNFKRCKSKVFPPIRKTHWFISKKKTFSSPPPNKWCRKVSW